MLYCEKLESLGYISAAIIHSNFRGGLQKCMYFETECAMAVPKLIIRVISLSATQFMWPKYLNVTYRRTDGRTTYNSNTTLWSMITVHRAVMKWSKVMNNALHSELLLFYNLIDQNSSHQDNAIKPANHNHNLHRLDFGDVSWFQRIKSIDGSLQGRNCLSQVALTLLLYALRSCCSLVCYHLITCYHLQTIIQHTQYNWKSVVFD